jgi:predicted acyl esterase
MEAWLLGDRKAVLKEFPRAKVHVLDSYVQDSVCGTWETLADAVFPGGSSALKAEGWPRTGQEKCKWAFQIGQHLRVESNLSPSLHVFRKGVLKMGGVEG